MKTVCHAVIDGIDVVTHIGEAAVDPQATDVKVRALVSDSPEWADAVALEAQIAARWQSAADAFQAMFHHSPVQLQSQIEMTYWGQQKALAAADIEVLNSQLVPLKKAADDKYRELWATQAVYSHPGPGSGNSREDLIADDAAADLQAKLAALGDEQRLTLQGEPVADQRGVCYWTKSSLNTWQSATIVKLGDIVPSAAIRDADLTDEQRGEIQAQREAVRVSGLTNDERLAEATILRDQAQAQAAATMTAKLSIGISQADAAAASTTEYKTALSAINAKYGTSLE